MAENFSLSCKNQLKKNSNIGVEKEKEKEGSLKNQKVHFTKKF